MSDHPILDTMSTPPSDTIFAKIVSGDIPAKVVYEDDQCMAFEDIAPVAPVHVLVIPKTPLGGVCDATADQEQLLGHCMRIADKAAEIKQIKESGYRLVVNHGKDGLQSVHWLHIHVLGGKKLGWPPC